MQFSQISIPAFQCQSCQINYRVGPKYRSRISTSKNCTVHGLLAGKSGFFYLQVDVIRSCSYDTLQVMICQPTEFAFTQIIDRLEITCSTC